MSGLKEGIAPSHENNIFWGVIAPDGWIPEERLCCLKKDAKLSKRDRENGWRVALIALSEVPNEDEANG